MKKTINQRKKKKETFPSFLPLPSFLSSFFPFATYRLQTTGHDEKRRGKNCVAKGRGKGCKKCREGGKNGKDMFRFVTPPPAPLRRLPSPPPSVGAIFSFSFQRLPSPPQAHTVTKSKMAPGRADQAPGAAPVGAGMRWHAPAVLAVLAEPFAGQVGRLAHIPFTSLPLHRQPCCFFCLARPAHGTRPAEPGSGPRAAGRQHQLTKTGTQRQGGQVQVVKNFWRPKFSVKNHPMTT